MAKKKPLRTLMEPVGPPDHFTMEEARAAVLAVMAERGETVRPDVVERARATKRRASRRPYAA